MKFSIDFSKFPVANVGPYERSMGANIRRLVLVFEGRVPDSETNQQLLKLLACPEQWTAGHAVFDWVRNRLLDADKRKDKQRQAQYCFEEACCQAVYNVTDPQDPFDPSAAYWVIVHAMHLARTVGVPIESVAAACCGEAGEQ
ncbi:MAG: hypothetical protein K2Z81_14865 [Cyanobacteria bacterium]|nr:hypothetical protein [Cyanobacteriota bacterium]